jgi:hypothetical protein
VQGGGVGSPEGARLVEQDTAVPGDESRVAMFREHPPEWWGWPWRLPRPLSVAELIAAGSLDARVAALLWVALERRASVLVAAGPNGAGKTVTLTALLDFLPPTVARVHLHGMAEEFAFVERTAPQHTYLLVNEISDHLPIYLWGRRVRRLFELVRAGYAVGATLHAASPDETLAYLRAPPLGLDEGAVAAIDLVVMLTLRRSDTGWLRRVSGVHVVVLERGRATPQPVALWDAARDTHRCPLSDAVPGLAERLRLRAPALVRAVERRATWLEQVVRDGQTAPGALRAALAAYRREHAP